MPYIIDPNGQVQYLPGAYTATRVSSSAPGQLPVFLVPVIIGQGDMGVPQGVGSDADRFAGENSSPWRELLTNADAEAIYGKGSEIAIAFAYAKRHGLPRAFACALNTLTRGKVVATSTGPVNQAHVRCALWGVKPGWTKVKWASQVWTVLRPSAFSLLSANAASGATRVYVKDNSWAVPGQSLEIGANGVVNASVTVRSVGVEYTSGGQLNPYIDLTGALGASYNTSAYAGIALYGNDSQTVTGVASLSAFVDAVNSTGTASGKDFAAALHADQTGVVPASIASLTPFKDISAWATVTAGTAPAMTTANVTTFTAALDTSLWTRFVQDFGTLPRSFFLVSSSSTNHATLRDYTIARRSAGFPISVVAGCAWGDTSTSSGTDTSPNYRSGVLNSQDFILVANGHNKLGSYLTTAAAVWGLQTANDVGHNLTADAFVGVSEWETQWSDPQLATLARAGVITNRLSISSGVRWVVMQGLNTLQANAGPVWNESDQTTWSVMQRDLMDFVDRTVKFDFDVGAVGQDSVSNSAAAGILVRRAQRSLVPRGYLVPGPNGEPPFQVTGVTQNESATGKDVEWSVRLKELNDYMAITTTILIG